MSALTASLLSSLPILLLLATVALLSSVPSASSSPLLASSASVLVDVSSSRHTVSDAIYGTNFFGGIETSPAFTRGWVGSTRMGGGDPTTVYNWRIDADNAGFDWFFQQRPRAPLGNNSADHFVKSSIGGGAVAVVDISSIGVVAGGRDDCYSFPISKFPDQQRHNGDMGNGLLPNGTTLGSVYGPQMQCYIHSVPKDAVDFVSHLRDMMGRDTFEASGIMQLDNEPEWWSAQHQDVHPQPFHYDEVWNMTRDWAGAIKATYPNVKVMGGVAGGWYPYLNGVNSDADPAIQSELLDQPRSLYDVTFVDPAGNSNPLTKAKGPAVIRQLHDWLRQYAPDCPNIAIAITEYAFGGAKLHTTALALAEVFSILAREQVSLATLFQIPTPDTAIYHSFELYNFNGSRIIGDSVHANSSAPLQQLTAYAQHDDVARVVYVKLFNKDNVTAVTVDVSVMGGWWADGSVSRVADVWQLQAAVSQPVGVSSLPPIKVSSNNTALSVTVECAPRTATVVRISGVEVVGKSNRRTAVKAARVKAITE